MEAVDVAPIPVEDVRLAQASDSSFAKAFCTNWVFPYGLAAEIILDNGSQFLAKYFQAVCRHVGIKNTFTTACHPQTNGQVERFNRTMLAGFRAFVEEHQRH